MFSKIKWAFYILVALVLVAFFHYSLPSRDIVQINGTEVNRIDVDDNNWFWASKDAGTQTGTTTRDVRFINAQYQNGDPRVYRNEDTGWSWPPYLKFDSGNLQSQAQGFAKTDDTWVAVSHYGWRIPLISMYPNAYKMKEVAGPDVRLIPWFNIIFLIIVFLVVFAIWRRVDRWKDKNIDPVLEDAGELYDDVTDVLGDSADAARERASQAKGRLGRWLDTWKSKK